MQEIQAKDADKTKEELINELIELRERTGKLEKLKEEFKKTEEALHRSEERFNSLFENMVDAVYVVSKSGKIISVNAAFERMTGWSRDDLVEKHFLPLVHPDDLKSVMEIIQVQIPDMSEEEVLRIAMDVRFSKKGGGYVSVEVKMTPLIEDGMMVGQFGIAREITERKRAEEAIKQREKELSKVREKLNEFYRNFEHNFEEKMSKTENFMHQREEFVNQLSHDLRNPLTSLVTLLPIIGQREKDPELKAMIEVIIDNTDFMKQLVAKTLSFAKLNSPDMEFIIEDTDVVKEVRAIVKSRLNIFEENNIKVENKIAGRTIVKADRLVLEDLFEHLFNNAIKCMPDGGTLTLDLKKGYDFVIISVEDTGIGLSSVQLNQIFEEYYKGDDCRYDLGSSGLGLPICKRIVEKHGGVIWAESPGKGHGATFCFTLKLGSG
ncbi:MAG: PAS domain-containing sensor histidine kinase [Halobacteriota archaeon]|nr:PAS domain-containing sensor histidine kinase [Halobacteriota archaeon]